MNEKVDVDIRNIPHISYGPSRIVDSAFETTFYLGGSLFGGFARGLVGPGGGGAASEWLRTSRTARDVLGTQWARNLAGFLEDKTTQSLLQMSLTAGQDALEGAVRHFAIHSPFAWAASGIQLAGKGIGGTLLGAVGQVGGEAVRGLVGGAAWLGTTLIAGALRAIPGLGNTLHRAAARAIGGARAQAQRINWQQLADDTVNTVRSQATRLFERIPEGQVPTNFFEHVFGYRLRPAVRGTVGRAVVYGLPAASMAWGALTEIGRFNIQTLQPQSVAGAVGSTYMPRYDRTLDDLGATGDLVLALHALR